jgi:hypothetical protein
VNVKGRHSGTIRYKRKYRKTKEETQRKSTSKPKKELKETKTRLEKVVWMSIEKGKIPNMKKEKPE